MLYVLMSVVAYFLGVFFGYKIILGYFYRGSTEEYKDNRFYPSVMFMALVFFITVPMVMYICKKVNGTII